MKRVGQFLARQIGRAHYFVENPKDLQQICLALLVLLIVWYGGNPPVFGGIYLVFLFLIPVFIMFDSRCFTSYLRKGIFFLIYILPPQDLDSDPALKILLRKVTSFTSLFSFFCFRTNLCLFGQQKGYFEERSVQKKLVFLSAPKKNKHFFLLRIEKTSF